jgi:hypothetical protein
MVQALLSRYEHFRGDVALQHAKMAEFVMAALSMAEEANVQRQHKTESPAGVDSRPHSEEHGTNEALA